MASGIRRVATDRGEGVSGISFVILYQIRLCSAEYYGRDRATVSPARLRSREREVMSNKMWGGRFTERPDAIMEEINVSIDVDRHLYAQDIAASKAHAAMLAAQGIITANDAKNIGKGLDTILSEISADKFTFKRALEDIHMNVESRLAELIGPAAGRLH